MQLVRFHEVMNPKVDPFDSDSRFRVNHPAMDGDPRLEADSYILNRRTRLYVQEFSWLGEERTVWFAIEGNLVLSRWYPCKTKGRRVSNRTLLVMKEAKLRILGRLSVALHSKDEFSLLDGQIHFA